MRTIFSTLICLFILNNSTAQTNAIRTSKPEKEVSELIIPMTIEMHVKEGNQNILSDFKIFMETLEKYTSLNKEDKIAVKQFSERLSEIYIARSFEEVILLLDESIQLKSHAVVESEDNFIHYFVFSLY